MNNEKKQALFRQGIIVLVVLAILTAVEYVVAINMGDTAVVLLFLISLLKAVPVLYFFMHIANLCTEEEGH